MAKRTRIQKLDREPGIADFGGDGFKMALQKAKDAGGPETQVRFTLEGKALVAWKARKDLPASVVAINLAILYERGEVRGSKTKAGPVEITVSDAKVLDTIAKMRDEYRESRPINRDQALDFLREGRDRIAHLKSKNSELDFGPTLETLEAAQEVVRAHALKADGDALDYRPVADKVREAVRLAENLVSENIAASIKRMGAGPDAEAKLATALAITDTQDRRNALLGLRHLLVGLGYNDPEHVSRRRPEPEQRRSGQPHRRREGQAPPRRFEKQRVRF